MVQDVLHAARSHDQFKSILESQKHLPPGALIIAAQPFPFRQNGRHGFMFLTTALDAAALTKCKMAVFSPYDMQLNGEKNKGNGF